MGKISADMRQKIDEKMQEGYDFSIDGHHINACDIWQETWGMITAAMDDNGIKTIEEFDEEFDGTQSVFNWSSDFEMELELAGQGDKSYFEKRIAYCREYIKLAGDNSEYNILNMNKAIAESYFKLGRKEEGEHLFQRITEETPEWSWGWIGWSDMYWLFGEEHDRDSGKAIGILQKALGEQALDERAEVQKRLKDIYLDLGMETEAAEVSIEVSKRFPVKAVASHSSVRVIKVGRNEPCPCGSGKKYKKCCSS